MESGKLVLLYGSSSPVHKEGSWALGVERMACFLQIGISLFPLGLSRIGRLGPISQVVQRALSLYRFNIRLVIPSGLPNKEAYFMKFC